MREIKLLRAQIGQRNKVQNPLDITVKGAKGGAKCFAPTWSIVMDHKNGKISDESYTRKYIWLLDKQGPNLPVTKLMHFGLEHNNTITFLCFCPDGKFCHTHLLIDYLVKNYPRLGFIDGR